MIVSEGFSDRITRRQLDEAQRYIDDYFPSVIWAHDIRTKVYQAFIDGGSATLDSIIGEIQNVKRK